MKLKVRETPDVSSVKLEGRYLEMVDAIGRIKWGVDKKRWRTQIIKMLIEKEYKEMLASSSGVEFELEDQLEGME